VKTSKKDFQTFRREVEKWVPILGLTSWRVVVEHKDRKGYRNLAWGCIDSSEMSCSIMLAESWYDNKINDNAIKRSAFHELSHVMYMPVEDMLISRGYPQDKIDNIIHGLIYIFENYIYGPEE
jgi:hypothetical protein